MRCIWIVECKGSTQMLGYRPERGAHLGHDVLVVVVAESAAQLVVVHVGLALALAPLARHLVRVDELELAVGALPADDGRVARVGWARL